MNTKGVTLHGSINPSDKQTTYHFEYGLTSAYGSTTADAQLSKSKAWQPVSAELAGLGPATTYHYRIVAWNGGGSKDKTVGADRSFTTAAVPPDPSDPTPPGGDTPSDPTTPGDSPGGGPSVGEAVRPVLGASVCSPARARPRHGAAPRQRRVRSVGWRGGAPGRHSGRRPRRIDRPYVGVALGVDPDGSLRRGTLRARAGQARLRRPVPARTRMHHRAAQSPQPPRNSVSGPAIAPAEPLVGA